MSVFPSSQVFFDICLTTKYICIYYELILNFVFLNLKFSPMFIAEHNNNKIEKNPTSL